MKTIKDASCSRMFAARPMARGFAALSLLGALGAPTLAHASGVGNLTYTSQELLKPIANFGGEGAGKWPSGPSGANTGVIIHQKLVIMGSNDSGKPPGSLHVYDISDPRNPMLQKTLDGTTETSKLRELHAMPVAFPDGKTLLVLPTTSGIQFFDFTDVLNPKPAGTFDLAGAAGGDYDNTVWMLSWEWPYVFAGGTGNGIFVVDATDPANCTLVTKITTGSIGGFRIGPTYAAGNFLVGLNMDQSPTQAAIIDVGNPKAPALVATGKTTANLYSSVVIGDRIYGPGTNGDYVEMKWSGTAVSVVTTGQSGSDRGGYCTYQSGFLICGQSSEGFKKWDMSADKFTFVGNGTIPNVVGDYDFATIMGNIVLQGNDHGSGSYFIPHQTAPDTVAPTVVKVFPSDPKQPLTTRITIFFSEDLDLDTVSPANIAVRSLAGVAVPGVFSKSSFNAISFGPKAPLAANTTYEVSIPAGGVTDLVGNKITAASSARFSTGAAIDTTGMVVNGGAGASGLAGASSGGSGGSTDAGGTTAAGGSTDAGGSTPAAGSATASAGTVGVGGTPATASGGTSAVGPGTGGGTTTSTGTAGSTVIATDRPTVAADKAGCGCSMPGSAGSASAWALGLGALGLAVGRLRGRNRRRGAAK